MTIRTIGLSTVVIAVLGVSAYAGTVTFTDNNTNPTTVATQLANVENVRQANAIPLKITSGVKVAVTGANLTITRTDGKAFDTNSSAVKNLVLEDDSNTTIEADASLTNDHKSIIFTGETNQTIKPGDYYYLAPSKTNHQHIGIPLTLYKGESGVGLKFTFSNQNGTVVDTATSGNLIKQGVSGFSMNNSGFSRQIDASSGFLKFTNINNIYNNDITDSAEIDVTSAGTNTIQPTLVGLFVQGSQTANLSGFKSSFTGSNSVKDSNTSGFADFNASTTAAGGNKANIKIALTADGKQIIPATTFTANKIIAEFNYNGGKDYNTTLAKNYSLGSWSIYGYSAVVPNVTYSSAANIQTVFTFTNQSSVSANVYFIVYKNNGGKPTTVNMGVLPAGYTKKYNFSDILAKGNLPQGSYTVKVSIPTTPTKVYGYASFRNSTLGAFKYLPMYMN